MPGPSLVEVHVEIYWKVFKSILNKAMAEAFKKAKVKADDIKALAIDSQGETLICVDENGEPLRNAIVWLDNRSYSEADYIRTKFSTERVYNATGQPEIVATWLVTKIMWLRKHEKEVYAKVHK